MDENKALRKEFREKHALKYAVFVALIGAITSVPIVFSRNQPDGLFITLAFAFGGFLSGYVFWRIIGGESKIAALFTGLFAGASIFLFAPMLFWIVLTLIYAPADIIDGLIRAAIIAFILFCAGIYMLGWFAVPISIVVAFILRYKIRKQIATINKDQSLP
ncbi:MAG: hypothetical protein LBO72_04600 [Helicobacteraceae bacterium]|jgi:hypothetical protein|nr:hypothetical protein [Helicobacteraceae bacterium]